MTKTPNKQKVIKLAQAIDAGADFTRGNTLSDELIKPLKAILEHANNISMSSEAFRKLFYDLGVGRQDTMYDPKVWNQLLRGMYDNIQDQDITYTKHKKSFYDIMISSHENSTKMGTDYNRAPKPENVEMIAGDLHWKIIESMHYKIYFDKRIHQDVRGIEIFDVGNIQFNYSRGLIEDKVYPDKPVGIYISHMGPTLYHNNLKDLNDAEYCIETPAYIVNTRIFPILDMYHWEKDAFRLVFEDYNPNHYSFGSYQIYDDSGNVVTPTNALGYLYQKINSNLWHTRPLALVSKISHSANYHDTVTLLGCLVVPVHTITIMDQFSRVIAQYEMQVPSKINDMFSQKHMLRHRKVKGSAKSNPVIGNDDVYEMNFILQQLTIKETYLCLETAATGERVTLLKNKDFRDLSAEKRQYTFVANSSRYKFPGVPYRAHRKNLSVHPDVKLIYTYRTFNNKRLLDFGAIKSDGLPILNYNYMIGSSRLYAQPNMTGLSSSLIEKYNNLDKDLNRFSYIIDSFEYYPPIQTFDMIN